jgi:hypothetical protein
MKKQSFAFQSMLSLIFILLGTSFSAAQRGALTVPRGLDQLVTESDTIVRGTVVSARVEPHPQFKNLMTIVVTMNVAETLKGDAGKTLQFRQYIWDIRDRLDAARYRKGDDLLLLLGPNSQYGLRSPSGLEQGRFRVTTSNGKTIAVNGRGNLGLFIGTEERMRAQGRTLAPGTAKLVSQKASGPIALADLRSAIRNFAGVSQ